LTFELLPDTLSIGPEILEKRRMRPKVDDLDRAILSLLQEDARMPAAEIGVLREPVTLHISNTRITEISGGHEPRIFEKWLASWDHLGMYEIAHCTHRFNLGVKRCKGEIGHDERVFGCMEFGIGAAWADAIGVSDGVVLEPTVWADDVQLEEEGKYIHPALVKLARQLGVPGY
jgi:leucyl aminopeptidase (aminopeptidase T)